MQEWVLVLMLIMGVALSGLVGVAPPTHIGRIWPLIRAYSDHSIQHQILDGVDQLQTRLDLLSERLNGL